VIKLKALKRKFGSLRDFQKRGIENAMIFFLEIIHTGLP
jgi:hypothetical protein